MQKTEWRGPECPPLYTVQRSNGIRQLTIYIDAHEEEQPPESEVSEKQWVATAIRLPVGTLDYGSIVDALIQHKYPYSRMEAVRNNHDIGTHIEEWEAMQEYRRYAKQLAKQIIEELESEK